MTSNDTAQDKTKEQVLAQGDPIDVEAAAALAAGKPGGVVASKATKPGLNRPPSLTELTRAMRLNPEKWEKLKKETGSEIPAPEAVAGPGQPAAHPRLASNLAAKALARSASNSGDRKPQEVAKPPPLPDVGGDPHPLQHAWTLYYDSKTASYIPNTPTPQSAKEGKDYYEANLQTIGVFKTVEKFCQYFNWVKRPSQLDVNSNYHIFKDDIKPMWEDPANARGGKWVISMRNPALLDRCWTWLVFGLVGEELDAGDDICGAVMSRRGRGDRIAVWVRDKDNTDVINSIGRRLLSLLDLKNERTISMEFQLNEDALRTGTSYNNPGQRYLTLESLRKEEGSEDMPLKSPIFRSPLIQNTPAQGYFSSRLGPGGGAARRPSADNVGLGLRQSHSQS